MVGGQTLVQRPIGGQELLYTEGGTTCRNSVVSSDRHPETGGLISVILFFYFLLFSVGVQLIYCCVVRFRCATQWFSYTYIYSFSEFSLILHNIEYSFLCSMVGPCYFFKINYIFLFFKI